MRADGFAVDKNLCFVAYGFKIETESVTAELFRFKFSSVPAGGDEVLVPDSRKSALRTEGNFYFIIKPFLFKNVALFSRLSEIEIKFPFAAEIFPVFSFKLRTGICRSSHKYSPVKNIFVRTLYHIGRRL